MASIEDFYLAELRGPPSGRGFVAGLLTIGLTVLSFVPAALVLVPLFWIYSGLGLPNNKVGSFCYGLFFVQPLGAAGAVGFKRWRESLLPIGRSRLVDAFPLPPYSASAPIPYCTSSICWMLNGQKHSADSSPAIYYLICGGDGFLTSRQVWALSLLESCFIASCLVALSSLFCFMASFDPNGDDPSPIFILCLVILSFVFPFGWYYLIRRLTACWFPPADASYEPPSSAENELEFA